MVRYSVQGNSVHRVLMSDWINAAFSNLPSVVWTQKYLMRFHSEDTKLSALVTVSISRLHYNI